MKEVMNNKLGRKRMQRRLVLFITIRELLLLGLGILLLTALELHEWGNVFLPLDKNCFRFNADETPEL